MTSPEQNMYEIGAPEQEINRLKDFDWPPKVSIDFIGPDTIQKDSRFVDIGAGSNVTLQNWVKEQGGRYLAVDVSEDMLSKRKASGAYGNLIGNADNLNLADQSFDFSHIRLVLRHLNPEERKRSISEALRIAKQKAFFIDSDWSVCKGTKAVEDLVRFITEEMGKYRKGDQMYGAKMRSEIEEVATEAGDKVTREKIYELEPGNHYKILFDLIGHHESTLELIEDEVEKEKMRKELERIHNELKIDAEKNIPFSMANLVAIEVTKSNPNLLS